jgi:hypothetical protein
VAVTPGLEAVLDTHRETRELPPRSRAREIRLRLGLSIERFQQLLDRYIDQPEALGHDPQLVMSLRRLREQRRELRRRRSTDGFQTSLPFGSRPSVSALPVARDDETTEAKLSRDVGAALADEAETTAWRVAVDAAIAQLAERAGTFTAEDVRQIAGDPPSHPNAMGARFMAASRRGLIRRVGFREAQRVTLHGHPIALWVGAAHVPVEAAS